MSTTHPAEQRVYGHAHIDKEWLGKVQEEIIEPELPIVDPHHHLWHDRPSGRYLPEDLADDLASGHKVVGTVFLQCGWLHRKDGPEDLKPVGETEAVAAAAVLFVSGAYGPALGCAGIVARSDLRSDTLDLGLDAHEVAGRGRFRGIRHSGAWDDAIAPTSAVGQLPGLMREPSYLRGLRRLGERGLTFDAWQYHPQMDDLLAIVRQAPGTKVVINHVGGPLGCGPYRSQRDAVYSAWLAAMTALAACPNTYVKLGGLGMPVNGFDYHNEALPPTSAKLAQDWRPFMEPCIELFGPARCMFESNFPVDKGMFSYPVMWNAFKRLASGASAADKAALFHDTAKQFYRLDLGVAG